MAAIHSVFTIGLVAQILDQDEERLEELALYCPLYGTGGWLPVGPWNGRRTDPSLHRRRHRISAPTHPRLKSIVFTIGISQNRVLHRRVTTTTGQRHRFAASKVSECNERKADPLRASRHSTYKTSSIQINTKLSCASPVTKSEESIHVPGRTVQRNGPILVRSVLRSAYNRPR